MTNKRYNIKPSNIVEDGFCIQDDEKEHSFPTVDDKSHLIMYEKALNEQDNRIKELEKENERLRMNQKSSIFNEDYRNYDNKGYTGETIEDIRFKERTEQAFERVKKSDSKGMTIGEFKKELDKW